MIFNPRLILKVAKLYYVENLSQRQISERLSISMASVSRCLTRAMEERVVEIKINDKVHSYNDLESRIESIFGLRECNVVPSSEKLENTYSEMAVSTGQLLGRIVHEGDYIGVSWGETLKAIGENMPIQKKPGAFIVPILGGLGNIERGIYSNSIAKAIADRLCCISYLLNAPAVLENRGVKSFLERDKSISQVIELWDRIDTALFSVSGIGSEASIAKYGVFSENNFRYLRGLGIAAVTNFHFLDDRGRLVVTPIDDRIIKMSFKQLLRVKNRIIIAAGAEKVKAVHAALKGQVANFLITDTDTAASVLKLEEIDRSEVADKKLLRRDM